MVGGEPSDALNRFGRQGERHMNYSIIGSGAIGAAIAQHFARMKTPVRIANRSNSQSLRELAEALGPAIIPSDLKAALQADVVVMAVPFEAVFDVAKEAGPWNGRIVVDATNAIDFPGFTPKDLNGRPSTHVIADAVPGARVVKTFNSTWARVLARRPDDARGRRVLFLAGDNSEANQTIADLGASWGFAPLDLGGIATGGLLIQFGGPLTTLSLLSQPIGGATLPEMDVLNP